jgi:hypothetical protein
MYDARHRAKAPLWNAKVAGTLAVRVAALSKPAKGGWAITQGRVWAGILRPDSQYSPRRPGHVSGQGMMVDPVEDVDGGECMQRPDAGVICTHVTLRSRLYASGLE